MRPPASCVFLKIVLKVAIFGFGTSLAKLTQATFKPLAKSQTVTLPPAPAPPLDTVPPLDSEPPAADVPPPEPAPPAPPAARPPAPPLDARPPELEPPAPPVDAVPPPELARL